MSKSNKGKNKPQPAKPATTEAAPTGGDKQVKAPKGVADNVMLAVGTKKCRVKAKHNQDWWDAILKGIEDGKPARAIIEDSKVPAHFVGYAVRRGWLTQVSG